MRSQIKDLLQMDNLSIDHKGELHAYTSDNLFSQISNLVSNRDKVIKTKGSMHKSFGSILTGGLGRPPYQYFVPEGMIYRTAFG